MLWVRVPLGALLEKAATPSRFRGSSGLHGLPDQSLAHVLPTICAETASSSRSATAFKSSSNRSA
ncbi:hypothetical protein ACFFX0_25180 [Citricoccus parietis]|uniref:Uncharacterized protein n=1 Tax=Citricoccus parietis TaxID=592307 RepID=A0ABV5G7A4_9MICC